MISRAAVKAGTLTAGKPTPELDWLEIALVNRGRRTRPSRATDLPRDAALNVARGGTLHQQLPDVVGERFVRRQQQPETVLTYLVAVEQGSRLHHLLDRHLLRANSFHFQAVAALGRGVEVSKRAPDGTVESVDAEDGDFVVAVQWHAEYLTERPDQAALCTSS